MQCANAHSRHQWASRVLLDAACHFRDKQMHTAKTIIINSLKPLLLIPRFSSENSGARKLPGYWLTHTHCENSCFEWRWSLNFNVPTTHNIHNHNTVFTNTSIQPLHCIMVTSNSSKPLSVYTSVHRVQSGTKLTLQCMHLAKNEHYTDQVTAEVTEWQNALPYWLQIVVKQCKTVRIFVWEQRWHVFARLWVNNVLPLKDQGGTIATNSFFRIHCEVLCQNQAYVGKNELFVNCCTSQWA